MTDLTRKAGAALWRQIYDALAAEIAASVLKPDQRLPTEPDLMQRFGVSRFTVRQALGHLEADGLVRAQQGRGTFVHGAALDYELSKRTRYSQNLSAQGVEPGGELLRSGVEPASELVAACLAIAPGDPVAHRRGLSTADGVPLELADSYYPAARFPDFDRARLTYPTISAAMASYGVTDYRRRSTDLGARMPTAEEARLLQQPRSSPVITVLKVDCDLQGAPICYALSLWAAERVNFTLRLD